MKDCHGHVIVYLAPKPDQEQICMRFQWGDTMVGREPVWVCHYVSMDTSQWGWRDTWHWSDTRLCSWGLHQNGSLSLARVMNSVNSRDQLVFYSAKTLSRVKYLIFCGHAELKGGRCTKTKCWGGFRLRGCCCGAFISEFTRRQRTIRV